MRDSLYRLIYGFSKEKERKVKKLQDKLIKHKGKYITALKEFEVDTTVDVINEYIKLINIIITNTHTGSFGSDSSKDVSIIKKTRNKLLARFTTYKVLETK